VGNGPEQRPRAFVLMPFQREFEGIYTDLIVPALDEAGYEVRRADSLLDQRNILADIIHGIAEADLIVAELTLLNGNVLYELGIAHGLMKPTVMITQDIEEVPFDLRSYRVITYSVHYNEVARLQSALRDIAQNHQLGAVTFGNPVKDFAPELAAVTIRPRVEEGTFETIDEDEEPPGLFDFMDDAIAAMEDITEHTGRINEYTEALGVSMQSRTAELQEAQASGGPGAPARQRRVVSAVASDVNDYVQKMDAELGPYEAAWNRFVESTTGLASTAGINDPEDRESAAQFKDVLAGVQESIGEALEGIQGFRGSLAETREIRLSRELNQSLRKAENSLTRVIDLLTTGISYISRVVNVLDERLSSDRVDDDPSTDDGPAS